MMNFKDYIKLCEDAPLGTVIPNTPFGAVPSEEGKPNTGDGKSNSNDFSLKLPEITVSSAIKWISGPGMQQAGQPTMDGVRKNVVHIILANGMNLFLSYDEFKRIHGEPRVGKMASVVLQRRPDDKSRTPSQVQSIMVS